MWVGYRPFNDRDPHFIIMELTTESTAEEIDEHVEESRAWREARNEFK